MKIGNWVVIIGTVCAISGALIFNSLIVMDTGVVIALVGMVQSLKERFEKK